MCFLSIMDNKTETLTIGETRSAILAEIGDAVTLVAVSKRQSDDRLAAALAAGQRVFGENRVQEAERHWQARRNIPDLELRLIGPLQTNKADAAVSLFDVIETLDREKLLTALIRAVERTGVKPPDLLIQVNTGDEPQKAGVSISDLPALLERARKSWPGKVRGLMCIPPVDQPPEAHFGLLKKLADQHALPDASMGMSGDYKLAVKSGATHIRLGTALFGPRED